MSQAHTCGRVRAAAPTPGASYLKQWKSDVHVKSYNSVSARSPLTKSKKKNYRERTQRSNINERVLLHCRAHCHARWPRGGPGRQTVSAPYWNQTQVARLHGSRLNHWAIGLYQFSEKKTTCCFKPLIANLWSITSYSIQQGVEIFPLCIIFGVTQCSSSSLLTLKKWELRTWNLGQIFEIKLWIVGK